MWDELAIAPTDDPKIIRRAYAARLRQIDPDRDREAFARLRQALEWALASAAGMVRPSVEQPRSELSRDSACRDADVAPAPISLSGPTSDTRAQAAANPPARDPPPADISNEHVQERALLIALESALLRGHAHEASQLYFRASATGALPLGNAERMLARLFAVALEDPAFDGQAFRELARCCGWDRPELDSAVVSNVRQRVSARLAAEDWYDALIALADRKNGTTRSQAIPARLMLKRIRRPGLLRVHRPALQFCLNEYKRHDIWLRDRIAPAWVAMLEARIRRRELIAGTLAVLFIGGMLLQGLVVCALETIREGFSPMLLAFGLLATAFAWIMKHMVKNLVNLWRQRPS
jgi:hypothetical protein